MDGGVQLVASVCLSIGQEVGLSCSSLGATNGLVGWVGKLRGSCHKKRLCAFAWECAIMAMSVGGESICLR